MKKRSEAKWKTQNSRINLLFVSGFFSDREKRMEERSALSIRFILLTLSDSFFSVHP
jgi:hypothetical protein